MENLYLEWGSYGLESVMSIQHVRAPPLAAVPHYSVSAAVTQPTSLFTQDCHIYNTYIHTYIHTYIGLIGPTLDWLLLQGILKFD